MDNDEAIIEARLRGPETSLTILGGKLDKKYFFVAFDLIRKEREPHSFFKPRGNTQNKCSQLHGREKNRREVFWFHHL